MRLEQLFEISIVETVAVVAAPAWLPAERRADRRPPAIETSRDVSAQELVDLVGWDEV